MSNNTQQSIFVCAKQQWQVLNHKERTYYTAGHMNEFHKHVVKVYKHINKDVDVLTLMSIMKDWKPNTHLQL